MSVHQTMSSRSPAGQSEAIDRHFFEGFDTTELRARFLVLVNSREPSDQARATIVADVLTARLREQLERQYSELPDVDLEAKLRVWYDSNEPDDHFKAEVVRQILRKRD